MTLPFKKTPIGEFAVRGSLWIECEDIRFMGPGPVELLLLIDQTGSINHAARKMGMSYKKAWGIIDRLNALSSMPLVVTSIGREKGGGSSISLAAKELISYHHSLRERFLKFLEYETHRLRHFKLSTPE